MGNRHEDRKENQYWIDPTGAEHRFIGDAENIVSIHYEIANSLFPNTNRPDDILITKGWVLVGSSVYDSPIIHKEPSQGQIDTLHDKGLLNKLCFLKDGFYLNYLKEQDKL